MWTSNQPLDVAGEVQCTFLDVNGNSDLSGNLTVGGLTTLHGNLDLQDNDKILLGTGDDLQIYHDGSDSYIKDAGQGSLVLQGTNWYAQTAGGASHIEAIAGSATSLFHNGNNKLQTTSTGINVTGTVTCDGLTVEGDQLLIDGNPKVTLKDSNSTGTGAVTLLEFMDSANDVQGQIGYTSNTNNVLLISNNEASEVRLATNGTGRCRVTESGHFTPVNGNQYDIGSSGEQWRNAYFDGTVNCDGLDVDGTASINRLIVDDDGSAQPTTVIKADDNGPWALCIKNDTYNTDENTGLKFYQNNTGECDIQLHGGSAYKSLTFRQYNGSTQRNTLNLNADSAVQLYYDGNEKLKTVSTGIDVTGTVNCDGMTSDNSITVNSGFGTVFIRDNNSSGTASQAQVAFRDSGSTDLGQIGYLDSANSSIYIKNSISGYGVIFGTNNTARCQVNADGHFVPNTDDTYDIGTSSLQWRDAFFDGTVNCDGAAINGKCTSEEQTATASAFNLANGNFWTFGAIAVPNPTNQAAGLMGSLRVTAAPTSFASNWKFPGGTYTAPTSFPAVAPFFVQASGTILVGSWTEGIA